MRIYVAGPYTQGSEVENIRNAIDAAEQLVNRGHEPFVPHLNGFWHLAYPHDYETWMRVDMAWLRVSDALVLLPGHSPGAQREVALAHRLGIPVFAGLAPFFVGHATQPPATLETESEEA